MAIGTQKLHRLLSALLTPDKRGGIMPRLLISEACYSSARAKPNNFKKFLSACCMSFVLSSISAVAADEATLMALPLYSPQSLEYLGGFNFPTSANGVSDSGYAQGPIAVGPNGDTLFLAGFSGAQAIAEFNIPALINSNSTKNFNRATHKQKYSSVLNRASGGNGQALDTIGGLAYVNNQLLINAFVYYDAGGTVTNTTLAVRNPADLASSEIRGYFSLAPAAHASGWITPIPSAWQSVLGGTYITGFSSGVPIINRLSVGPSAFVFSPDQPRLADQSPGKITTKTLLDYSLDHPLGYHNQTTYSDPNSYLYNMKLTNNLWTHMSSAVIGFIVPGTRTYLVIGNTGGLTSGIGYKATQETGYVCPGGCSYNSKDYYNYYWAYDLKDMLKVMRGEIKPYEAMPYTYGKLNLPIGYKLLIGGSFDPAKGIVYLAAGQADIVEYYNGPSVLAFRVTAGSSTPQVSPPNPPQQPQGQVL